MGNPLETIWSIHCVPGIRYSLKEEHAEQHEVSRRRMPHTMCSRQWASLWRLLLSGHQV